MSFQEDGWKSATPYGAKGWMYLLVTFLAFLFFYFAGFTCWFTVSQTTDLRILVGYWSREAYEYAEAAQMSRNGRNYCVSWDDVTKENLFDGAWRFGRMVSVVGAMISAPIFLTSICMLCLQLHSLALTLLTCMNTTMAILSLLLLSGLGSNVCEVESCRIGPGGYMAIIDFFLWIAAAIMAFLLIAPTTKERKSSHDNGTVASTRKQKPRIRVNKPIVASIEQEHSVSHTEIDEEAMTKSPDTKKKKKKKEFSKQRSSKPKQMEEP